MDKENIYSMTVFKNKKDGLLYLLHEQRNDEAVEYTAVPYRHDGKALRKVGPDEFTIHEKKPHVMKGFL